jgi:hypothetical protein
MMLRYVGFFLVGYFLASVLLSVIAALLSIKALAVTGLPPLFVGAFLAAHFFAKKTGRPPSSAEANAFAWLSLAAVLLLSLALALALGAASGLLHIPALVKSGAIGSVVIASVVVICAAAYFAVRWAFSWYTKKVLAARQ